MSTPWFIWRSSSLNFIFFIYPLILFVDRPYQSRIEFGFKLIFLSSLPPTMFSSLYKWDLRSSIRCPCSHKIASWMPSWPLRYNCVGRSHLCRPETASVCVKDNDPVRASKGSNKNDWSSLFLSLSFLIFSNRALLVSMPIPFVNKRESYQKKTYIRSMYIL